MEKEINNNENTNNNDIKDKQDNRMEVSDDEGSNMYIDDDGDAKRINNKNNNNKKESKKIIKEFDKDARDRLNNNDNEKKEENEEKFEKIKLPKRKYAIVHGYIGHKYSGNQKNPNVFTVEEVIEKALFNQGYISPCNFGVLQKIGWARASRTDKKVSAAMNLISCKLHYYEDRKIEDIVKNLNKELEKDDIRIIQIIEVSGSFDAKECSNNREYHYILPAFCLQPRIIEEQKKKELGDKYSPYDFRITPEFQEKIQSFCTAFRGSKKYHNYTRRVSFRESQATRIIFEVTCHELFEYDGVQYIKFKLIGQSFLYNQIRKMIGMVIEVIRENKSMEFFENSFTEKSYDTPIAPAEGLYLLKVDYSKYNTRKTQKKSSIELDENMNKNIDEFSILLKEKVHESEFKNKVFTDWLGKFDDRDFKNEVHVNTNNDEEKNV